MSRQESAGAHRHQDSAEKLLWRCTVRVSRIQVVLRRCWCQRRRTSHCAHRVAVSASSIDHCEDQKCLRESRSSVARREFASNFNAGDAVRSPQRLARRAHSHGLLAKFPIAPQQQISSPTSLRLRRNFHDLFLVPCGSCAIARRVDVDANGCTFTHHLEEKFGQESHTFYVTVSANSLVQLVQVRHESGRVEKCLAECEAACRTRREAKLHVILLYVPRM